MKKILLFLIISLLSLSVFISYSQSLESESESTQGEVVSASNSNIVIEEYDYEKESYINKTFIINSKTEIIGVDTITEITEGTTVEIEYTIDSKNNFIAKSIYVSNLIYDEDEDEDEDEDYDE